MLRVEKDFKLCRDSRPKYDIFVFLNYLREIGNKEKWGKKNCDI